MRSLTTAVALIYIYIYFKKGPPFWFFSRASPPVTAPNRHPRGSGSPLNRTLVTQQRRTCEHVDPHPRGAGSLHQRRNRTEPTAACFLRTQPNQSVRSTSLSARRAAPRRTGAPLHPPTRARTHPPCSRGSASLRSGLRALFSRLGLLAAAFDDPAAAAARKNTHARTHARPHTPLQPCR